MTTFRLTIKALSLPPVPPGYPMFGVPRKPKFVYRVRRGGEVAISGTTTDTVVAENRLQHLISRS